MKKLGLFIAILVVSLLAGQASASLYDFYSSQGLKLPSIVERTPKAIECGIFGYSGTLEQNIALETCLLGQSDTLGGTLPVAGVTYTLAGSGVTSAATSITLTSLTIPQTGYELLDADFSSTFYVTLEPGNTKRQEIVSCTTVTQNANNTATISGCTRGLLPFSPYTTSSSYQFSHAGGTSLIFSDAPQLFNEYVTKANDEVIAGGIRFSSTTYWGSNLTSGALRFSGGNLQWSNDGFVNSYNFTSSSISTLSASTTAGIGITDSKIYVNVSTTQGMTIGSDGAIYQKASSTAGILTDSNGHYVDPSYVVLDTDATSTPTASKIVQADSAGNIDTGWIPDGGLAINWYTAGEAINASSNPLAVYLNSTDGKIYKTSSAIATTTFTFIGFLQSGQNLSTNDLGLVQASGVVFNFTGLTIGSSYFILTAGTVSSTAGTVSYKVGRAISTTSLLIEKGRKIVVSLLSDAHQEGPFTTTNTYYLGFYPSKITYTACGAISNASAGNASCATQSGGMQITGYWRNGITYGAQITGISGATPYVGATDSTYLVYFGYSPYYSRASVYSVSNSSVVILTSTYAAASPAWSNLFGTIIFEE